MIAEPHTDTRSPWYECFEPQEPLAAEAGLAAYAQASLPADTDVATDEPDWALEALFDYYNA